MILDILEPKAIEAKSFEMIEEILGDRKINEKCKHIVKRCIHTSADFDYVDNLHFSDDAVESLEEAFKNGCYIVTDTQMAKAGINKKAMQELGIQVHCFIADEDVSKTAKEFGTTRAAISMEKASMLDKPVVFAIGNAPTALIKLHALIKDRKYIPAAIIAVPVGFVNVVESKELIQNAGIPCIVAKGRKGGSNIAAAICNAIAYNILK